MGSSESQARREELLAWMRRWKLSSEHTVAPPSDLKRLEAEGHVRRLPGRPARWEAVRQVQAVLDHDTEEST